MIQTELILVRHVETVGNIEKRLTGRQDYELTPKGKNTVEKLTNFLKNKPITAIYSSTSNRTFETVKKIAQIKGLQIQKEENLCEMYFGIYDGWKWEEVNKVNPLIHKNHVETNEIMGIPEQETTEQVAERMYKKITEIAIDNVGKTVLIASHGVAIEAFLRKITKEKFTTKINEYSQHNGSINILNFNSTLKTFSLIKLNDINYAIKN